MFQEKTNRLRIQPALHGLDPFVEGLLCVAGQDRNRLLGQNGPGVDLLSRAMWTVVPVTFTPAASASRTACHPLKAGRSAGWVLRMRPA